MSVVGTRIVSFGGSNVRIDYTGAAAATVVDFLYRDIPRDHQTAGGVTLRLQSRDEMFVLECEQARRYQGTSAAVAASILLRESMFHLANHNRHGLLIHAAAVHCQGGCLLMPGKTAAGKTTLTAWLTQQGLGYLTDELVHIPLGSRDVHAFTRPLNVKASARHALAGVISFVRGPDVLDGPGATLVRAERLDHRAASPEASRLAGIVFPRYQTGSQFHVAALTKGRTAFRLTECLINARNLPAHGLHELARLARAVRSHEVRYSEFSQLDAWVSSLVFRGRQRDEDDRQQ